ncbi:MAG: hypothetical protein JWO06_3071, partial [Bacteroidota bacterium]|nr:hypothetical protein [Bacteroidota bacterium]
MNNFCTISTSGHLYKAYALADSLRGISDDFILHILVVDSKESFSF